MCERFRVCTALWMFEGSGCRGAETIAIASVKRICVTMLDKDKCEKKEKGISRLLTTCHETAAETPRNYGNRCQERSLLVLTLGYHIDEPFTSSSQLLR